MPREQQAALVQSVTDAQEEQPPKMLQAREARRQPLVRSALPPQPSTKVMWMLRWPLPQALDWTKLAQALQALPKAAEARTQPASAGPAVAVRA